MQLAALALLVAGGLTACGGRSGGSDSSADPMSIQVSGVAATGAAIDEGSVVVKCAAGTGTATTQADGSYAVSVENGSLPCIIRVTKGGTTLHSLIETGAPTPVVANVTPLTELLVAQMAGTPAASIFDNFNATAQAKLTSAALATASDQLVAALSGVLHLESSELLRGTLVAAINGEDGNLLDQKLDALGQILQFSGVTLDQLTQAIVASPGQAATVLDEATATAVSCPSLRSGIYWGLEAEDPQFSADPAVIDARALTITYSGEDPVHLTPVEGKPCLFAVSDDENIDGTEEVIVTRAGMIITRFPEDDVVKTTVGFPKQQVTQAELVGDWNYVGWVGPMSNFTPVNGAFTLNAAGEFSNVLNYVGATLEDEPPGQQLSLVRDSGTGAFRQIVNGETSDALFLAFRTPEGRIVLVGNPQDGPQGLIFAMKRSELPVPAVGSVSNYWEFGLLGSTDSFSTFDEFSNTVTAVNGSNITRRRPAYPDIPVRFDTLQVNQPRAGMRMRNPGACTNEDGSPAACAGMMQLTLQGAGVTVAAGMNPNSFFVIAASRP